MAAAVVVGLVVVVGLAVVVLLDVVAQLSVAWDWLARGHSILLAAVPTALRCQVTTWVMTAAAGNGEWRQLTGAAGWTNEKTV